MLVVYLRGYFFFCFGRKIVFEVTYIVSIRC